MKKTIILFSLLLLALSVGAQPKIADLLREMPDSLLPLLSKNNRLDMIDFCEAKMKAEVTNLLEGNSEMTALTDDSLSIQLSGTQRVDIYLVEAREEYDSCRQVVCMVSTYQLPSTKEEEVLTSYYSVRWNLLLQPAVASRHESHSTILREDEKLRTLTPIP
jgi:hypothetical protein